VLLDWLAAVDAQLPATVKPAQTSTTLQWKTLKL
jgi:hypothetical protein